MTNSGVSERVSRRRRRWIGLAAASLAVVAGGGAIAFAATSGPEQDAYAELHARAENGDVDPDLVDWMEAYADPDTSAGAADLDGLFNSPDGPDPAPVSEQDRQAYLQLVDEAVARASDVAVLWNDIEASYLSANDATKTQLLIQFVIDNQHVIQEAKDAFDAAHAKSVEIQSGR